MQIILDKKECFIIYEALLTEITEQTKEMRLSEFKGRGEHESKYIEEISSLIKRFTPYV